MKLVIREYLASLRERGELDAVLPDLLTELGLIVYSRPARGTRQYGVDVAAVGQGQDGIKKIHLFSVKSGDLNRKDWNTFSPQSLRPSLDEIIDVYIPTRIPPEYQDLPIVICLCFGGTIDEQVRAEVTGYMNRNTTYRVSFEEWNGDRLAQVVLDGILREELLTPTLRSHLRKAVAMIEEPDVSLDHFDWLLQALTESPGSTLAARLSQARLINICLWIMFAWAREANNVEAPYRASERALLQVWQLLRCDIAGKAAAAESAGSTLNELFEVHAAICTELFDRKIIPHASAKHALSSAVGSHSALDINLKLFDLIGRLAQYGLWLVWELCPGSRPVIITDSLFEDNFKILKEWRAEKIQRIDQMGENLVRIISNNRSLLAPIGDWQAIDIGIALTFLACREKFHADIDEWCEAIARRSIVSFRTHRSYPITSLSYWDLADHPADSTDIYRQESTEGSILYPMLALWASARGNQKIIDDIAEFQADSLQHCTFQAWLPDENSEESIYLDRNSHGGALTDIPVKKGTRDTLEFIMKEISNNRHYDGLSAVRLGHWPLVIMACRTHRLPVPPQVWQEIFVVMNSAEILCL